MENIINRFKKLNPDDFRILRAIEKAMQKYKHVPISEISNPTKFNMEHVSFLLNRLHKLELINRWSEKYVGYHINEHGYDCLALNGLVQENILASFGKSLGVGKESDVFAGLTPSDESVAIKVHRQGRVSFRQTKRYRGYIAEKHHLTWLYASRLAAEKEYEALKILYSYKVAVPKPYGQNRHMIVMENIAGDDLCACKVLPHPDRIFKIIMENIEASYKKAQIIHGDLSEFNVIIVQHKKELQPIIIDWPQWVPVTHPNAIFYLTRDITSLCNFFKTRFGVLADPESLVKQITES